MKDGWINCSFGDELEIVVASRLIFMKDIGQGVPCRFKCRVQLRGHRHEIYEVCNWFSGESCNLWCCIQAAKEKLFFSFRVDP